MTDMAVVTKQVKLGLIF